MCAEIRREKDRERERKEERLKTKKDIVGTRVLYVLTFVVY